MVCPVAIADSEFGITICNRFNGQAVLAARKIYIMSIEAQDNIPLEIYSRIPRVAINILSKIIVVGMTRFAYCARFKFAIPNAFPYGVIRYFLRDMSYMVHMRITRIRHLPRPEYTWISASGPMIW